MGINYSPKIVTDGLVLYLDAANPKSYPGSGTTWYDLSGNGAHAEAVSLPTFVAEGPQSYWLFDAIDDEFHSVDISQDYRDLFVIHNLTTTSIAMLFGHYNDLDDSLRFASGYLRASGSTDINDWHYLQESDVYTNGNFNTAGVSNLNQWNFLRSYRGNESGFGTSFRYEISSSFYDIRRYKGKINAIFCYNRKLSDEEVKQNFNALRGRFGI